jgi:hypothetical protein
LRLRRTPLELGSREKRERAKKMELSQERARETKKRREKKKRREEKKADDGIRTHDLLHGKRS